MKAFGQICSEHKDGEASVLSGWACCPDGSQVDNLYAFLPNENIQIPLNCRFGLPVRGELCRYFPEQSIMRNSGFELALPRDFSRQLKGDRFQLIPTINGEDGEPMEWVRHPRLPIPNDSLIEKVGGGGREGFLRVGFEFLGHLIHKANLLSLSRVLDVGCGVGRVAYALSHYLDPDAAYEGFDVCEKSIDWANREIGGLHPNFAFKRIDLQHDLYNPKGVVDPLDFQFPYEENSFDLVFLASVFTHMSAIEIRTYLNEIRRVLRSGGTCLMSAFIMDEVSTKFCEQSKSNQCFVHRWDEGFTVNPECPEDAVAFEENLFLEWLNQSGYEVKGCFPGYWSGRSFGHSYQDLLVATVR